MKLATAFALAVLLALGLASCGESSSSQSRPSATLQLDFATTTQQATPQTCSYSAIPSNIISNMQEFEDLERQLSISVDSFLANPDRPFGFQTRELIFMGSAASGARQWADLWVSDSRRPAACAELARGLQQTTLTMESLHRAWESLVSALVARDDAALQSAAAWLGELDEDIRQIACDLAASDGIDLSVLPRC